jgi:uncharacterized membrane-anchored protein YhcB (DUF1043 family)
MSAFPWATLITAVSTLIAGLGAVGLKGRSDRKDRKAQAERENASIRLEQQRLAYQALVATSTELLRNYRQLIGEIYTLEKDEKKARNRNEKLHGELFQAVAAVELAGTEDARVRAGWVRDAAGVIHSALARNEAEAGIKLLDQAIGAFIDGVRP